MSQIQSNIGLITGIPIQDTVNQLIQIAARPRNLLQSRTNELNAERTAIDQVASLLLGFRFAASRLDSNTLFNATTAKSSDSSVLTAAVSTTSPPRAGSYSYTPLQLASAHQVVSSSFSDVASQLTSGNLRIGVGGHVDRGIALNQLNAGGGVKPGAIRITDRSGVSAEIDLRTATSIEDVLSAINTNGAIDVTATVEGDAIKLTDNSGGGGSLRVKEVGVGTTAAALGLVGINVAADEATGSDIFTLHSGTLLRTLNDGNGVRLRAKVDDLEIALADSSTLSIDLGDAASLGDVVDAINAADNTKLTAAISADGNRLELTDLTSGGGTFAVVSAGAGTAAEDLGLTQAASGGAITGARLASGLRGTLIRSLNGGQGYGDLGSIEIIDRGGTSSGAIDLSAAETLSDIVDAINASGAGVTASINFARNGIAITDNSGGIGNLQILNSDSSNTADALGLTIDDAVNSVNSGSLNRQTISEATRLATFGGGKGVRLGDFKITDSSGAKSAVSLDDDGAEAETIGDVIDRINALSIGVEARINDTGDGILITDIAGGEGTLTVAESGSGKTAADLRILAASDSTNLAGEQIIDGSISISIDLSQLEATSSVALSSLNNGNGISLGIFAITDNTGEGSFAVRLDEPGNEAFTIDDVITKINDAATAAGVQVSASLNKAGTGIQLTDTAGGSGELTVDDKGSGRSAEDLKLTGEVATNGGIQTIDGKGLFTAQDADQNTLDALAKKINDQGAGFSASTFFDGSGFRISITADSSGAAHELLVDAAGAGFSFEEIGRAQDAVLQVGGSTTTGLVITSSTNEFAGVTQGLDVTIQNVSDLPVTITVARDDTEFVDSVTDFVDSYNSLRSTLDELTSFNAETLTTGLLFGRSEVLRVERDLSRLLSGRFTSSTEFKSLEEIGVSLDDKGKLSRDKKELSAAYAANPQKLEQFFKADGTGVIDQFTTVVDRLAGEDNSLLSLRSDALTDTIDGNEQRVARYDEFLERERARTLLEFFRLEETISKLQVNLSVLDSLQSIAPLSFARKNN